MTIKATTEHSYAVTVTWTGNTGAGTAGYRAYGRDHEIIVHGKPAIPASSDPAFRGDTARYNPEEMLVASLSSCHMLWYLHLCAVEGIVVLAYQDIADGVMTEDATGGGRFTQVVLQPEITLAPGADLARARALHADAQAKCFIANSVNFTVRHEPVFPAILNMLALTMGDPAGIGGEITLKAWSTLRHGGPAFAVLDDPARLRAIDPAIPTQPIRTIEEAAGVFPDALPVLATPLAIPATPGRPDPANAAAILASIEDAVRLVQSGRAGAVVTNPISKAVLYQAGFPHPGHTEFLGALTGAPHPVMMLANDYLRVVPVTVHLGLRAALDLLSTDMIVTVARIAAAALQRQFGIARPRLGVAGLNPHAGESGTMGHEEDTIIEPAIRQLRRDGIDVKGPYPPDAMFTAAARPGYDAAICMYHDQALIPLKTLDMVNGVNVTLGLPIVRTSPDHGTAFDIAGHNRADPASLIAALRLAATMAAAR